MQKLQKPVAITIILSLILDLGLGIFIFKPNQVQAFSSVEGQVTAGATTTTAISNWGKLIKEIALDALAWTFKDMVINQLKQKIMDWGLGRKSDKNEPFLIVDWGEFFKEAFIIGTAKFIAEYDLIWDTTDDLDNRIKGTLDSLGFNRYYEEFMPYSQYARTTLYSDLGPDRYERFLGSNYSLRVGGWTGFFSLLKPQNNVFGQIMMASYARRQMMEREEKARAAQAQAAKGYKNEEATTKTNIEQCKEACVTQRTSPYEQCVDREYNNCINTGASPGECSAIAGQNCANESHEPSQECTQECESRPEVSLQTRIKNWGQHIEKNVTDAIGADMAKVLNVDEISELLGITFSALLNKAVDGLGLGFSAKQSTPQTRARADYRNKFSYGRSFKKSQTKDDVAKVRTNVLSGILKAIQSLSRSILTCDQRSMMNYDEWTKNLADVLEGNVEALYVGLEGVNLKSDFTVLDSAIAPYGVYGYSYSHIPYNQMPSECRAITDQLNLGSRATCMGIVGLSGLEPLDPTQNELACPTCTPPLAGFTYTGTCAQCMYDHDSAACPPAYSDLPWPRGTDIPGTVWQQKWRFYDVCRNWYLQALNRCDECLKKADEKCDKTSSEAERRECINNGGFCDNYSGLEDHITGTIEDTYIDPGTQIIVDDTMDLDFYDKCMIEEKKEACFTCLKEYYVPATYCDQVNDYVVRSIDRYPALVKIVRDWASDEGKWFGPRDIGQSSRGGTCDDNYRPAPMDLSLMCRIAPDFTYNGTKLCNARCRVGQPATATQGAGPTIQEMQDITDFRPHGGDCNNATLPSAVWGSDAWNATADGTMRMLGKCCGALHADNTTDYARCLAGAAPLSGVCTGRPLNQEPMCHCDEGWRPMATAKNLRPMYDCPFPAPPDGPGCFINPQTTERSDLCRANCKADGFEVPDMVNRNRAVVITNAAPGGAIVYIGQSGCENDADCIAELAQASFLEKIAKFFKPLMPYEVYAQDCNCNSRADCDEGERCRFAGAECRDEPYTGTCEEIPPAGTCTCSEENLTRCSPGQYCDTDASIRGECFVGTDIYNGLCADAGTRDDVCEYHAPDPGGIICQMEAYNSTNSSNCCYDLVNTGIEERIAEIGPSEMICDLSGTSPGTNLFLGAYANTDSDCKTDSLLCIQCDPNDPGYPNYGYGNDQCNNKIPPAQR